jgi:hypothetical protein
LFLFDSIHFLCDSAGDAEHPGEKRRLVLQGRQAEIAPYEHLLQGLFSQVISLKQSGQVSQKRPFVTPDKVSKIVWVAVEASLNVKSVVFRHSKLHTYENRFII